MRLWVENVIGRQIINMEALGGTERLGRSLYSPERGLDD
jgi:hypothetical protein